MNDFFTRQENARRCTGRLLLLFGLAVLGVVCAVNLLAAFVNFFFALKRGMMVSLWQPHLFLWTSLATLTLITLSSISRIMQLREGGAVIAMSLGATPVPPHTSDPRERQLRNVMEEMAIASGVPVPDLYLLDRERGINAFAAGFGPSDAVICVTRGAAELLDRDEMQGVMAHEFSHILNGDVLLNIRLLGWLGGIQVVTHAGKVLLDGTERTSGRGSGGAIFLGGALFLIGYIGHFFAQLIKSAVSRQREFLADASAVQFTRLPDGLAGALKKIGGLSAGSRLSHPRAVEMSHMFFGNGLHDAWFPALDSHPPLTERIRLLEPGFNGVFPQGDPLPVPADEASMPLPRRTKPASSLPEQGLSGAAVASLLNSVGEPVQQHLDLARRLIAGLPPELQQATRAPLSATALGYGLLLDCNQDVREKQLGLVAAHDGEEAARELRRLIPELDLLAPQARLPLLDLSLPALRRLSSDGFARFKRTTDALAAADGRLSVFELTMRHLLMRHLQPHYSPSAQRAAQIYGVRGVQEHCSRILTTLARVGNRDETAAAAAFAAGVKLLQEHKTEFSFLPASQCNAPALEAGFAALEGASPLIKKKLLAACLECITHDQVLQVDEVELFRGIADAIGCPVPPWLTMENQSTIKPAATRSAAPLEAWDAQQPQ